MPTQKIEIVRSIYDRWAKGDFGASVEVFDERVVFYIPPQFPDTGTYLGKSAIADYMRGFLEPWTRITIEAEELVPVGDTVFAGIVQRGVGEGSGAATELRYFQLWTFRGERVIRLENVRDRAEALEAAGLAPDG